MAIKTKDNKYKCMFCDKTFPDAIRCDIHRDSEHNIIYVPIEATDLSRLHQFLFHVNKELLTDTLIKTIVQYAKISAKRRAIHEDIE